MKAQEDNDIDDNGEDHFDDIRMENEIKKIKLSLEYGMDISGQFTDPDLPPEVEGQFLDYIQQFEAQFSQQKSILVYELAGRPDWRPVAEISEDELIAELDRIINILHEHSISIETICDVEEKELYRFITEELFQQETSDIRIEGMTHGFIYEEFHPNHEYDIKNRCREFSDFVLSNKDESSDCWAFAPEIAVGKKVYTKEEFREALKFFRDSFNSFAIDEFECDGVVINDTKDEATARYRTHYSGQIEGSVEIINFKGESTFMLKCDHGWWAVCGFEMPGLVINSDR
jgi:hypothetical protein